MIELLTANTPNGKKISIMLEEINFEYKVTKINISKDEQFKPNFIKLSPFRKIPVIIDHDAKKSLFESGAILGVGGSCNCQAQSLFHYGRDPSR